MGQQFKIRNKIICFLVCLFFKSMYSQDIMIKDTLDVNNPKINYLYKKHCPTYELNCMRIITLYDKAYCKLKTTKEETRYTAFTEKDLYYELRMGDLPILNYLSSHILVSIKLTNPQLYDSLLNLKMIPIHVEFKKEILKKRNKFQSITYQGEGEYKLLILSVNKSFLNKNVLGRSDMKFNSKGEWIEVGVLLDSLPDRSKI